MLIYKVFHTFAQKIKKDFICEKVIDSSILTDGFQLYNNLITSELKDKT